MKDMMIAIGVGKKKEMPPALKPLGEKPNPGKVSAIKDGADSGPDEKEDSSGKAVPPDAVAYRTEEQQCVNCEYLDSGGECSWLKIPVDPHDSCSLFEASGNAGEDYAEAEQSEGVAA